MNWETLLAFGDSITFGARGYLGYPELCGDILSKKLDKNWNVINHSTNGFTTIDLVRSIDKGFQNFKIFYPSLITVMIGTNDIKNNTSDNDFEIAYNQLITKLSLLSINNNVLLLNIPRLRQKVFYPYNYSMNGQVIKFNSIIQILAEKNNLRTFNINFNDDDFFDGVHLNDKGSNTAASQICEFILKDKGIESSTDLP